MRRLPIYDRRTSRSTECYTRAHFDLHHHFPRRLPKRERSTHRLEDASRTPLHAAHSSGSHTEQEVVAFPFENPAASHLPYITKATGPPECQGQSFRSRNQFISALFHFVLPGCAVGRCVTFSLPFCSFPRIVLYVTRLIQWTLRIGAPNLGQRNRHSPYRYAPGHLFGKM